MQSSSLATLSWRQLTSIQIGGAICLPVILIGQELCQRYGVLTSIFAIVVGNFILLVLGIATSTMSTSCHKSTVEHAQTFFGKKGSALFALVMIAAMVSWFAIQLNMMSLSILEIVHFATDKKIDLTFVNLALGLLITLSAKWGVTALRILSDFSLPIMIATLGWALFSTNPPEIQELDSSANSCGGISLVIAAAIAAVVDMPTFFRHAKQAKDGIFATIILFCIALPLIEGVGVYLAASAPGASILETLQGGHGQAWCLWIALFILLAGWTTNNTNLFSAAVSAELLLPKTKQSTMILILGVAATIIACANPLQHIEGVITLLGIAVGSMGGAVIAGHLLAGVSSKTRPMQHLICWILGSVIGLASMQGWIFLSGISLLDSYLGACCATLLLKLKEKYETAYTV